MIRAGNLIVASVLVLLSLGALWGVRDLDVMSAIFPKTIATLLLAFSSVYLIKSLFTKYETEDSTEVVDKKRVFIGFSAIAGYVFFIWLFGFIIASFLFIGFFVSYLQDQEFKRRIKFLKAGISAFVLTVTFYLIFEEVLNVPLPNGILFI